MNDSVEALEKALQVDGDITLRDGRKVVIRKCQLRQLGVVAKFVQKVQALAMTDPTIADAIARTEDLSELVKDRLFITQLIIQLDTDVYTLISGFCGLTEDELASLELDEALVVISRVVGDNMDFFVRQVLPMVVGVIEAQAAKIEMLTQGTGAKTSSTPSSSS